MSEDWEIGVNEAGKRGKEKVDHFAKCVKLITQQSHNSTRVLTKWFTNCRHKWFFSFSFAVWLTRLKSSSLCFVPVNCALWKLNKSVEKTKKMIINWSWVLLLLDYVLIMNDWMNQNKSRQKARTCAFLQRYWLRTTAIVCHTSVCVCKKLLIFCHRLSTLPTKRLDSIDQLISRWLL